MAPVTATPAAPAAITSAALPASMPPWASTGMPWLAVAASASRPRAGRSRGFDRGSKIGARWA
jgi:hypothetical protein